MVQNGWTLCIQSRHANLSKEESSLSLLLSLFSPSLPFSSFSTSPSVLLMCQYLRTVFHNVILFVRMSVPESSQAGWQWKSAHNEARKYREKKKNSKSQESHCAQLDCCTKSLGELAQQYWLLLWRIPWWLKKLENGAISATEVPSRMD